MRSQYRSRYGLLSCLPGLPPRWAATRYTTENFNRLGHNVAIDQLFSFDIACQGA